MKNFVKGTKVKIFTKNGIVFCGDFISEDEKFITIVDRYDGLKKISLDCVADIGFWRGRK